MGKVTQPSSDLHTKVTISIGGTAEKVPKGKAKGFWKRWKDRFASLLWWRKKKE